MDPRTIAVVGSLAEDLIMTADRMPDNGETLTANSFSRHPGGKGANSAVAAYRLSHFKSRKQSDDDVQVRMTGAVGDDKIGRRLIEKLDENKVDTSKIRSVPDKSTGTAVVIVTDFGENRILVHPGANYELMPKDFLRWEDLAGGVKPDLLITQLEIGFETVEQVLKTAMSNEIDVLLKPAPASFLVDEAYEGLAHLIVNETEAAMLATAAGAFNERTPVKEWGKVADEFLGKGAKNVVITLGAKGAYYSNQRGQGHHAKAVPDVNVIDTTGAGDTFVGAYAVEFVKQKHLGGWNIKKAVEFACKASARTIEKVGALETIPWADEHNQVTRKSDH
ncbi:MAG: hypothetical protein Q9202_001622 [Teloschistes flavicans]